MTDISDIEPYSDQDVPQVIDRLINDDEFIKAIGQLKFKGWFTPLSFILRPRIRSFLRSMINLCNKGRGCCRGHRAHRIHGRLPARSVERQRVSPSPVLTR